MSRLVLFRWVFCYLFLYTMPSTGRFSLWPLQGLYSRFWQPVVTRVATRVFHIAGHDATYFPTGSGDTTLGYVENYCFVVLAFAGCVLWSALDRKRADYAVLEGWLRIWIRFTLAATMLLYGFAKVFPLQMPLYLPKMVERWGDFSPMGALWSFMAASRPYTILSGAAEVLGGVLLLFRRTTLLGSMVSFGIMFNVAALNYCYDVPVKLYSTNLLLMCVFLMGPDLRRLAMVFVLNRPVPAANLQRPDLSRLWMRIVALLAKGGLFYYIAMTNWDDYKEYFGKPPGSPAHGFYEVERFDRNHVAAPPLVSDLARWRWFHLQSERAAVTLMNDERVSFDAKLDAAKNTLTLSKGTTNYSLSYTLSGASRLTLRGKLANDEVEVSLRRLGPADFRLLNRGFHWVNEYPFNR